MKKIKILAIGNSFSQDATALIELLTDKIYVRNLAIGGCTLQTHAYHLTSGLKPYQFHHGGDICIPELVSVEEALAMENWDYITVQQASGVSGVKESYNPYLKQFLAFVRERSNAKIVFHQTWAYEKEAKHGEFINYHNSQAEMWRCIKAASEEVCKEENLQIIPSGETIAKLRENAFFDVEKGGLSLCRDGFHMSLNYGRFATAATWIKFFTGEIPDYLNREDISEGYKLIKKALI